MTPDSHYASADRSSSLDINLDGKLLASEISFLDVLGAISGITAVLNENRQIVYANEEFLKMVGINGLNPVLGKRPGEAVACIHAGEMMNGCGTSEACSVWGAVNAIIESQKTGEKTARETRITSEISEKKISWDLKVTSSPVTLRDRAFYIFTVEDISNQKRRQNLERIFFHDILNSAGNLSNLLALLKDGTDPEEARELIDISEKASRELIEEIMLHRQIRSAENGDLVIKPENLKAVDVLKSAVEKISRNELARNRNIYIEDSSPGAELRTDRILLQRILINLLKNAIEATSENGTVYSGVEQMPDHIIRFTVKNDAVIAPETSRQIFQRSFTTKGKGRGTGTYSIRLLTENYLMGKVFFTSSEHEGTVFNVDLPVNGIN